jgi:hypothetical protein
MATRRSSKLSRRPARATRQRRRRLVGAVVGTAVAAAGGWLLATGGTAATPPPSLRPIPPELRLGQGAGDLTVTGGGLQVPVVDTVEMLPRCHP